MDRDEDFNSPLPHHVQFNGRDESYIEVPGNYAMPPGPPVPQTPATAPNNVSFTLTAPGSPQKKLVQPLMETVRESEESIPGEAENESNNSADR